MILCPVNTPVCHAREDAPDCVFLKKSTLPHDEVEGLKHLPWSLQRGEPNGQGLPALINPDAPVWRRAHCEHAEYAPQGSLRPWCRVHRKRPL